MDPITHGALGALTGILVGRKRLRLAAFAGAAGAMLPDVDVVFHSASNPLFDVLMHRHFTHALAFVPVGGAIAAGLVWLVTRKHKVPYKHLYLYATAGYATHGLLDALTSYGTLWFWPFSMTRIAWDVVAIVDPLVTLPLLLGIAIACWKKQTRPATFTATWTLAYFAFLGWQQHQALALLTAQAPTMERPRAMPQLGRLFQYRTVYLADGDVTLGHLDMTPLTPHIYTPIGALPQVDDATLAHLAPEGSKLEKQLRLYQWFTDGYLAFVPNHDGVLGDYRYALDMTSLKPVWGIQLPNTPDENVTRVSFRGWPRHGGKQIN